MGNDIFVKETTSMNDMKCFIEDRIATMKETYLRDPNRINHDYYIEREKLQDYHGRELLELLQNADDAALDTMPKKVKITFREGILEVSNYGEPFSEDGIISLMYSHVSPKRKLEKETIGNKGTGFRSILSWADEIQIHSGKLHVKFTEKHSQAVLNNILSKLKTVPNGAEKAATLVFPEWIDASDEISEYTTTIIIRIKKEKDVSNDITKQIESLDQNVLLFLNNTEELTIESDDCTVKYVKKTIRGKVVLSKYIDEKLISERKWSLTRQDGVVKDDKDDEKEKRYHVIIAHCDDNLDSSEKYIYSYFKTEEEFPYPFLLHASFKLTGNRNHLLKDKVNTRILYTVAEAMVEAAISAGTRKHANYDIVKMLIPEKELSKALSGSIADYHKMVLEAVKKNDLPIFPNVNGKYIPYESKNTIRYYNGLSKYIKGEDFANVLQHTEEGSTVDCFINEYAGKRCRNRYDVMAPMVERWVKNQKIKTKNEDSNKERIRKIIKTALALFDEYQCTYDEDDESFPELFINSDRNIIPKGTPVFIVEDNELEISKLPKFAHIEFMEPYMASFLLDYLGKYNGTDFYSLEDLAEYNIRPFNPDEIIEHLNECLEQSIKTERASQTKKKWIAAIKWIWNNRQCFSSRNDLNVYFLTRDKKYLMSNKLYAGKEYGNDFIEELLGTESPVFAADIRSIGDLKLSESEISELMELVGIERLPRIKKTQYEKYLYSQKSKEYPSRVLSILSYPCKIEDGYFNSHEECIHALTYISLQVSEIKELEDILEKSPTESILEWIKRDSRLKKILFDRQEQENSRVRIKWGVKQNTRNVSKITRAYPYILFLFETIPWIEVDGNRYCINDCLIDLNTKVDLSPYLVQPNISNYIKKQDGKPAVLKKEYISILKKMGVKKGVAGIAELPLGKIYSVLKALPEIEGSEKVAKAIYEALVTSSALDDVVSRERTDFINHGKVLCNNGFVSVSDAYYLAEKTVSDRISDNFNLIRITSRKNASRIEEIFGVKRIDIKGEIIGEPIIHRFEPQFSSELKRFYPMAFCCRLVNIKSESDAKEEARKINNTKISLCSYIKAEYNDEITVELNDYEYVLSENHTAYIKVPDYLTLDRMQHNMELSFAVAGALCSSINISVQDQIRELFYCWSNKERKKLLIEKYEDETIIEKAKAYFDFSEDVQDEFIRIFKTITGYSDIDMDLINGLDFDEFNGIGNSKAIIKLFKDAGIDVSDYNSEEPTIHINLIPYYEGEIERLKSMYLDAYKLSCFRRLENKSLEDKKGLVDQMRAFDQIRISAENTVNFDVEAVIKDTLNILPDAKSINLPDLYRRNMKKWKNSNSMNLSYSEEFFNDSENMSLLYYHEYPELNKRYEQYLNEQIEEISTLPSIDVKQVLHEVDSMTIGSAEILKGKDNKTTKTAYKKRESSKELEKIGRIGERLLYDWLTQDKTIKKVIWVSENANKENVNPEGRAGLGYDFEIINENDERILIEAKASKLPVQDGIKFHLTDNEYSVAIEHGKNYVVYYIGDVCSGNPVLIKLVDLFDDGFNREKYTVECKSEYTISCRVGFNKD